ncbi:MAG: hypothetical protein Q9164_004439 [Protoblastenia rupestris]
MASIPLHCNICPKEPEFSDISHLLTHVASKGHLSHYFKAQVRARQDENIRHRIDTYDRWYDQYQIEKLLSQRMSSKEKKDGNKQTIINKNRKSVRSARPTKPRTRRIKKSPTREPSPSPVKTEDIIDPQLSYDLLSPHSKRPLLESPSQEAATRHRAYVPRMLDGQTESPSLRWRSSSVPINHRSTPIAMRGFDTIDDTDGDYFRTFLRSPTRVTYPDPTSMHEYTQQHLAMNVDSDVAKITTSTSPVLKGVKWPGMSLFDSASQEAQRLRNQKKDGSVLEQMEIDSAAIEPMEHIYWPEGGLKKKRLITGNVESSPVKEPTPPPRRPCLRASKVLANISTNAPKLGKKRGRKVGKVTEPQTTGMQNMADTALTTLGTVYQRNSYLSYDPFNDSEYETLLGKGSPVPRRQAAFSVFRDSFCEDSQAFTKPLSSADKTYQGAFPRQDNVHCHHGLPAAVPSSTESPALLSSINPFLSRANSSMPSIRASAFRTLQRPVPENDKENASPNIEPNGLFDESRKQCEPERVTQRYFSISGNEPPRFFSAMPPQMDFGGMASPAYYGTSLNPLNSFLRHRYQNIHYPRTSYTQAHASVAAGQRYREPTVDPTKCDRTQKSIDEPAQ